MARTMNIHNVWRNRRNENPYDNIYMYARCNTDNINIINASSECQFKHCHKAHSSGVGSTFSIYQQRSDDGLSPVSQLNQGHKT